MSHRLPHFAGLVAAALLSATLPSSAQDAGGPRFMLRAHENGFIRLDRITGSVSFCRLEGGNLACWVGAREREAYQEAIGSLEDRLSALEQRMDELAEAQVGQPERPETGAARPDDLPEPQDGMSVPETARELTRRALHRFFARIAVIRADFGSGNQRQ